MNVGIVGAGNIARAYFAYLSNAGHSPRIWSPRGVAGAELRAVTELAVSGAVEGRFIPELVADVAELAQAEVIILALPATGHRAVLDALLPHLRDGQSIIISAHLSFAALHLGQALHARGLSLPVICWNTTAMTCKSPEPPAIRVGALRKRVDVCTLPGGDIAGALTLCEALFGPRFQHGGDLLDNALGNLNPQTHLAMALCNLTRIETGEQWHQNSLMTPSVARFLEGLDAERLAIARGFGRRARPQADGAEGGLDAVFRARVAAGTDPLGPVDPETRYITEDVPFGLVPLVMLAEMAGVPVPLHEAGIRILSACHGRDYSALNDLMPQEGASGLRALLGLE
ncbi:NAD/NADP octopine/nopaline dehydrogenase family protein [Tropicimonas sp. IMCC34011]|uniref:NAD/NADP octopine/nopaline dehydrogenase family protein n=1 Tax=Tropicimonas sp. IMCC34011 TaxID=2248759 RepID=UPI000E27894C|nr:NAD/NADP octopine/nopaline dehydrogenase family protein [Tropicimonas sp. IMCC34011]